MIIKGIDNKDEAIVELERIAASESSSVRARVEREIRMLRAGIKGERESAYLIDFDFAKSKSTVVIHDLRLEIAGRVAQIDHLMINRVLDVLVLESKHFHSGLKITEEGEFLRWNDFKKSYEGMASPLTQNERHIQVLRDVFRKIDMPSRLGVRLSPSFHSYILVSPSARIDRPKKFDTSRVIKADGLKVAWNKYVDSASVLGVFGGVAKIVSAETVLEIGQRLVALHQPAHTNHASKFGVVPNNHQVQPDKSPAQTLTPPTAVEPPPGKLFLCRTCASNQVTIQYGKYGYYFKCASCAGNTPIKIDCGIVGHRERLRKDGSKFFRECSECRTSRLFFDNETPQHPAAMSAGS